MLFRSKIGVATSGFVSLETLVSARPDFLIVSDHESEAIDQGQAFLSHPALLKYWPRERRLVLRDIWRFVVLYKEFKWGRKIAMAALQRPLFGGYPMMKWL